MNKIPEIGNSKLIINRFGMRILDFKLNKFFRILWTSKMALDYWQPRINSIIECLDEIEWKSISFGIRKCSLKRINKNQLEKFNLIIGKLGLFSEAFESIDTEATWIIIGKLDSIKELILAYRKNDNKNFDRLLGAPECCSNFCNLVFKKESLIDIIWPTAYSTNTKNIINEKTIEIEQENKVNIFLNNLGIRPVFHFPCSLDCKESIKIFEKIISLFEEFNYYKELEDFKNILQWPLEWSSLHGISEIKTPVFKISMNTDSTPENYTIRFNGKIFPENGSNGITFPFRKPAKLLLTESKSYKEGLKNI